MATALTELEEKVLALNPSEKLALIRLLVGELDGPPESGVEKAWFLFYGFTSTFYRIFITFVIALFIGMLLIISSK